MEDGWAALQLNLGRTQSQLKDIALPLKRLFIPKATKDIPLANLKKRLRAEFSKLLSIDHSTRLVAA